MLSGVITNRYTQGLYLVAHDRGIDDEIDSNLQVLTQTLEAFPELKSLLENPIIGVADKDKVVKAVFGDQFNALVLRFVHVLFERDRSGYLAGVYDRFHSLVEAARDRVTVEVESANPLSDTQIKAIEETLGGALGKQAHAVIRVNPELLAGYRATVGNRVLDATIRGALAQFSQKLLMGGAIKEGTR